MSGDTVVMTALREQVLGAAAGGPRHVNAGDRFELDQALADSFAEAGLAVITGPQIVLGNAHATSGGTGPGVVTVPLAEAQALVGAGYARFVPGRGPGAGPGTAGPGAQA